MIPVTKATMKQKGRAATTTTTDTPIKLRCHIKWWNQVTGKAAKMVYCQWIMAIIEQLQKTDSMITLHHFYRTDRNTPDQLCPLLQGKHIKLPPDQAGMKQYCPRQPPLEQPGYASIHVYIGHTKLMTEIMTQMKVWLVETQMTISLTSIQEEKAQEICWPLYTMKQSNCMDLAIAITATIGIPTALHFKQIQTEKQGTRFGDTHNGDGTTS